MTPDNRGGAAARRGQDRRAAARFICLYAALLRIAGAGNGQSAGDLRQIAVGALAVDDSLSFDDRPSDTYQAYANK